MSLRSRMTLSEAGRELLRLGREYAPSIAGAAAVAIVALALFGTLRGYEDAQIRRMVEVEGRNLSNAMGRGLETRVLDLLDLARRWEGESAPDSARWTREAEALAEHDPVFRAFEWRDAVFQLKWSTPLAAELKDGELDTLYEADRVSAAAIAGSHPAGSVAASFPAAEGHRLIVFAAPLLREGRRVGVLTAIARARDVIDAVAGPELRRGFSIAVGEGPYHVYGPLASGEGPEAERWRRATIVEVGGLIWRIEYWPTPEFTDRLRSYAPPWVLISGLLTAMLVASLIHTLQVARRGERDLAARLVGAYEEQIQLERGRAAEDAGSAAAPEGGEGAAAPESANETAAATAAAESTDVTAEGAATVPLSAPKLPPGSQSGA